MTPDLQCEYTRLANLTIFVIAAYETKPWNPLKDGKEVWSFAYISLG